MQKSIQKELLQHVIQTIQDTELESFEDLHHECFNADYYIIGHYNAEQWLKKHDIDAFEAIADVIEWEEQVFGEVTLKPEDINPEKVVNLYVYVKGEELLSEFNLDQSRYDLLADLQGVLD